MEEDKKVTNEVTEAETKEEIKPKYIIKKPKAPDIFTMVTILGKIGINKFSSCLKNEDVQELVKKVTKQGSFSNKDLETIAGIGVITEAAQIILMGLPKCEDDVYKLLANTSNLEIDEVKELDGVTFVEMLIDFINF